MTESSNGNVEQQSAVDQQDDGRQRARALRGGADREKPPRNWDAYAALVATLIGLLALMISGYTAYVQRQQLRAQVWPYVTVGSANVPPEVGLHAINSGTGPARVTAVRVTVDNRSVASWAQAKEAMGAKPGGVVYSRLSNSVLPAGKDLMVIRPYNEEVSAQFDELFLSGKHVIVVSMCYCSVLDECWTVMSGTAPVAIADPEACPIASAERFKQ